MLKYTLTVVFQFINSFVSGYNNGEDFIKRAQNFTVAELIPYKVKIILNAYNHSEDIAKVRITIVFNSSATLYLL